MLELKTVLKILFITLRQQLQLCLWRIRAFKNCCLHSMWPILVQLYLSSLHFGF